MGFAGGGGVVAPTEPAYKTPMYLIYPNTTTLGEFKFMVRSVLLALFG